MTTLNDILDRWDYEALAKRYRAFNKFEVEREERRAKGEIVIEEGDHNAYKSIHDTSTGNLPD